jgi:hypothetical protein
MSGNQAPGASRALALQSERYAPYGLVGHLCFTKRTIAQHRVQESGPSVKKATTAVPCGSIDGALLQTAAGGTGIQCVGASVRTMVLAG